VRSAHGADDSVTLLARICESIGQTLELERVGIVRNVAHDDPAEAIAAHGWPLRELADFAATPELRTILSGAELKAALVLAQGLAPAHGTALSSSSP
jgi:hypothetical protein